MTHQRALKISPVTAVETQLPRGDLAEDPLKELEPLAAWLVGRAGVDGAINQLRRAMLCEALSRTSGNYTRAALLLGVQRQAVQNMVSRYELRQWARSMRGWRGSRSDAGNAQVADTDAQLPRAGSALDHERRKI